MKPQSPKGYQLTEEEQMIKDTVHAFAKKALRPAAPEYDRREEPAERVPRKELEQALSTNGLGLGMAFVPSDYDGSGYGLRELSLIAEELAWGDLGFVYSALGNMHSVPAIVSRGTSEQKRKWLPAIVGGDAAGILVSAALTEPDTGSNLFSTDPQGGIQTSAHLEGRQYRLNGPKCFINMAGLSDLYLVWARTAPFKDAADGELSVFMVPSDTPGLKIGKIEDFMGIKTAQLGEVILEDCRISADNLLGSVGDGLQIAFDTLPLVETLMGAAAVGISQAAFEAAKTYAAQRITGKHPINQHQAVAHKLVDMNMMIEATRSLVWRSACMHDGGLPDVKLSLMCKVFGSETAQRVTADAVQIVGAYGYSREFPVEKYMRDAKSLQVNGPDLVMRNHLSLFI